MANSETHSEGKNSEVLAPAGFAAGKKSSRHAEDVLEEAGEEEEGGVNGAGEAVGLMFELLVFKLSKDGKGVLAAPGG